MSGREGVEELELRQRERGGEHGSLHGRPGVLRFEGVETEYARLRGAAGIADGHDRALLEVHGERARETFGGLVTQHVEGLGEGRAAYAFMLTPKGRPVAEMRVVRLPEREGEERLLLDLPAACLEGASEHFGRYLPPRLARVEEREDLFRLSVIGPASDAVIAGALGEEALAAAPLHVAKARSPGGGASLLAVRREEAVGPGHDLYLPAAEAAGTWEALVEAASGERGGPAGLEAREVLRVELGIPLYGREVTEEVLPQETGQSGRAVSFEKGCYTGQEVVARIHYRGHVNRHLRGLRLPESEEGDELPEPGTPLYGDDRERGAITTAVRSPRLGPIALGFVRREIEPGSDLGVGSRGGPAAEVVELPFPGV